MSSDGADCCIEANDKLKASEFTLTFINTSGLPRFAPNSLLKRERSAPIWAQIFSHFHHGSTVPFMQLSISYAINPGSP